jgi:hypothetical protein
MVASLRETKRGELRGDELTVSGLWQLRVFVDADDCGSLSSAARKVQPPTN